LAGSSLVGGLPSSDGVDESRVICALASAFVTGFTATWIVNILALLIVDPASVSPTT